MDRLGLKGLITGSSAFNSEEMSGGIYILKVCRIMDESTAKMEARSKYPRVFVTQAYYAPLLKSGNCGLALPPSRYDPHNMTGSWLHGTTSGSLKTTESRN